MKRNHTVPLFNLIGSHGMFRILVAEPIAEEGLARLVDSAQVDVKPTIKRPELLAIIGDYDARVRSATKVDAELLALGSKLRVVGRAGTGVDNIDVESATRWYRSRQCTSIK
jgi:D-3-phosphoglycerate dehydrogenase